MNVILDTYLRKEWVKRVVRDITLLSPEDKMYRKRHVVIGIIIAVIVAILAIAVAVRSAIVTRNNLNAQIEEYENELAEYESRFVTVYQVATDVKANNSVMATDLRECEADISSVPENVITDPDELSSMMYKIDLSAGTYLTSDMVMPELLTDDMRELDVVLDEIPIGLQEGDYVDVRVSFPLGQDYIAMTHKKVLTISRNVLKLVVGEDDFYTYESLKTDRTYYKSTKMYAVKYVEAGLQASAQSYYPVSLDILKTRILDPNIKTGDYSDIMKSREQLELQLESMIVDVEETVTGKDSLIDIFNEAKEEYEQLQAEKEAEMEGY